MQTDLHFDSLPALFPRYLRALINGRSADRLADREIPASSASVDAVCVYRDRLNRFRALLAHPDDGALPPTFPQVLAAPLHMSLLTSPRFPLRATGLVHLENSISVYRKLDDRQPLQLAAALTGADSGRGIEIDLSTTASVSGDLVWCARCLLWPLREGARQRSARPPRAPKERSREIDRWRAARNVGRRYARVSGDYNPIHLSSLTARPFGFAAAIAPGMWSLGRAIAALHSRLKPPLRIVAAFRRPMLLPASLRLVVYEDDRFSVEDTETGKAYLGGSIGALSTAADVS